MRLHILKKPVSLSNTHSASIPSSMLSESIPYFNDIDPPLFNSFKILSVSLIQYSPKTL